MFYRCENITLNPAGWLSDNVLDHHHIINLNQAMLSLFRPHDEHVDPSILLAAALCFVIFWGLMLKFSSEFVRYFRPVFSKWCSVKPRGSTK
jgi:hypothetical protein